MKKTLLIVFLLALPAGLMAQESKMTDAEINEWKASFSKPNQITQETTTTISESSSIDGEIYYPLETGYKWVYKSGEMETEKVVIEKSNDTDGTITAKIKQVFYLKGARMNVMEKTYIVDRRSISEYGTNPLGQNFTTPILRRPAKVGVVWEDSNGKKYTIVNSSKTVTTPAGTFKKCLVVKIVSKISKEQAEALPKNFNTYNLAYYAPKVGYVRESTFINGKEWPASRMELTEYSLQPADKAE